MSGARDEILGAVRAALRSSGAAPSAEGREKSVLREYRKKGTLSRGEMRELFFDRLRDYEATVHETTAEGLPGVIAGIVRAQNKHHMLVPGGIPQAWLGERAGFRRDYRLTYEEMDASDGVMTRCALAIALTGTIVLRHSTETGRRALTLIPDYHLCIVEEGQLVETVPEAVQQMAEFGTEPITTISGPSATADIEMTRIKGVHGPRFLEVIFVREAETLG